MKAKDLKKILVNLKLCDRTFKIAFDFNALAEIDDIYEGGFSSAFDALANGKGQLKALRALVYGSIKPRYENVTLLEIGELMTDLMTDENKMQEVIETIQKAITLSMPQQDKETEGATEGE